MLDGRSRARLGDTGLDLAAGFLAHRLDAQELLPPEARHELLPARIDVFVRDNLADPALTPGAIAARHHISVRLLLVLSTWPAPVRHDHTAPAREPRMPVRSK